MKKYGMIVADNGSSWYFQGATDTRWNDNDLEPDEIGTRQRLRGRRHRAGAPLSGDFDPGNHRYP